MSTASISKYDLTISIVLYKPNLSELENTLKSVLSSSLDVQIQLIDNSPKPLDPDFLKQFSHTYYTFNKGTNMGFGKAHNRLISTHVDDSKYFLVLNPDVYFEPKLLEKIIKRMEQDTSIGLSIPRICYPSGTIQHVNRRLPRPQDYLLSFISKKTQSKIFWTQTFRKYLLLDMDLNKPLECPVISGCFMFFRSTCLKEVGGFDERFFLYLEDTDLSRRVSSLSRTVIFSDLKAYHHWQRGAHKNIKLFLTQLRNTFRYFNKWGWLNDVERQSMNSRVNYYHESKVPTPIDATANFPTLNVN